MNRYIPFHPFAFIKIFSSVFLIQKIFPFIFKKLSINDDFEDTDECLEEDVDIHINNDEVTIADDSGEDVALIPINPEDEENESLNEDVKSVEEKAHDEVVKKVFEPRGITELDWSVEEQEDDDGYEWLNIVHFLTKED